MKKRLQNIYSYFIGNYRYFCYYNNTLLPLLRPHVVEQIEYRINSMDKTCYIEGQCKMCGCQTTALQMADKACDKPCYPEMVSKRIWEFLKMEDSAISFLTEINSFTRLWSLDVEKKKFIEHLVKEEYNEEYELGI